MLDEIESLKKNHAWEIVSRPNSQRVIYCKWIFKVNEGVSNKNPVRFKASLVAKGFIHVEGVDYNEIFFSYSQVYYY